MAEETVEYAEQIQPGKRRSSLGALSKSKPVTKFKAMFENKGQPKQKDPFLSKLNAKPSAAVSASHDISSFADVAFADLGPAAGPPSHSTISLPAPSDQDAPTPTAPLFSLARSRSPSFQAEASQAVSSSSQFDSLIDGYEQDVKTAKSPSSGNILKRMSKSVVKLLTPKSGQEKSKRSAASPGYPASEVSNLSPRPSGLLPPGPSSQQSCASLDLGWQNDQLCPAKSPEPHQRSAQEHDLVRKQSGASEDQWDTRPSPPSLSHQPRASLSPQRSPVAHAGSILDSFAPRSTVVSPTAALPEAISSQVVGTAKDTAPGAQASGHLQTPQPKGALEPFPAHFAALDAETNIVTGGSPGSGMEAEDSFAASLTASPAGMDGSEASRSSPPMREVNMGANASTSPSTDSAGISRLVQESPDEADGHETEETFSELVFPSLSAEPSSPGTLPPSTAAPASSDTVADGGEAQLPDTAEPLDKSAVTPTAEGAGGADVEMLQADDAAEEAQRGDQPLGATSAGAAIAPQVDESVGELDAALQSGFIPAAGGDDVDMLSAEGADEKAQRADQPSGVTSTGATLTPQVDESIGKLSAALQAMTAMDVDMDCGAAGGNGIPGTYLSADSTDGPPSSARDAADADAASMTPVLGPHSPIVVQPPVLAPSEAHGLSVLDAMDVECGKTAEDQGSATPASPSHCSKTEALDCQEGQTVQVQLVMARDASASAYAAQMVAVAPCIVAGESLPMAATSSPAQAPEPSLLVEDPVPSSQPAPSLPSSPAASQPCPASPVAPSMAFTILLTDAQTTSPAIAQTAAVSPPSQSAEPLPPSASVPSPPDGSLSLSASSAQSPAPADPATHSPTATPPALGASAAPALVVPPLSLPVEPLPLSPTKLPPLPIAAASQPSPVAAASQPSPSSAAPQLSPQAAASCVLPPTATSPMSCAPDEPLSTLLPQAAASSLQPPASPPSSTAAPSQLLPQAPASLSSPSVKGSPQRADCLAQLGTAPMVPGSEVAADRARPTASASCGISASAEQQAFADDAIISVVESDAMDCDIGVTFRETSQPQEALCAPDDGRQCVVSAADPALSSDSVSEETTGTGSDLVAHAQDSSRGEGLQLAPSETSPCADVPCVEEPTAAAAALHSTATGASPIHNERCENPATKAPFKLDVDMDDVEACEFQSLEESGGEEDTALRSGAVADDEDRPGDSCSAVDVLGADADVAVAAATELAPTSTEPAQRPQLAMPAGKQEESPRKQHSAQGMADLAADIALSPPVAWDASAANERDEMQAGQVAAVSQPDTEPAAPLTTEAPGAFQPTAEPSSLEEEDPAASDTAACEVLPPFPEANAASTVSPATDEAHAHAGEQVQPVLSDVHGSAALLSADTMQLGLNASGDESLMADDQRDAQAEPVADPPVSGEPDIWVPDALAAAEVSAPLQSETTTHATDTSRVDGVHAASIAVCSDFANNAQTSAVTLECVKQPFASDDSEMVEAGPGIDPSEQQTANATASAFVEGVEPESCTGPLVPMPVPQILLPAAGNANGQDVTPAGASESLQQEVGGRCDQSLDATCASHLTETMAELPPVDEPSSPSVPLETEAWMEEPGESSRERLEEGAEQPVPVSSSSLFPCGAETTERHEPGPATLEDNMVISPLPARFSLQPPASLGEQPSLTPCKGAVTLEAMASASPPLAARSTSTPTAPTSISPETARVGVRAFQLDDIEAEAAVEEGIVAAAFEVTEETLSAAGQARQDQRPPFMDAETSFELGEGASIAEQPTVAVAPGEEHPMSVPAAAQRQPSMDAETSFELGEGASIAEQPAIVVAPGEEHPMSLPAAAETSSGCLPETADIILCSVPANEELASIDYAGSVADVVPGDDADVVMADSLEAMVAEWGNDDLLAGDADGGFGLPLPQAASSPVGSASRADPFAPSPLVPSSTNRTAQNTRIEVARESIPLFSMRASCMAADTLDAESFESLEGPSMLAKSRAVPFLPMTPLKEGTEQDADYGIYQAAAGISDMAGSSMGAPEAAASPAASDLSFAGMAAFGSPADRAQTPSMQPMAASASPARRLAIGSAAHGRTVQKGMQTAPVSALKALAAASTGSAAAKAPLAKRASPAIATRSKPPVTPGSASSGYASGGSRPAAVVGLHHATGASAARPSANAAMVTPASSKLPAPGVLSKTIALNSPAMGAIGSSARSKSSRPGPAATPSLGLLTPLAAQVTPDAHNPAATRPAGTSGTNLFDTPMVLRAAAMPLADSPFPGSDLDLDMMDLSAEASKAIAMLGAAEGNAGTSASTMRMTPGGQLHMSHSMSLRHVPGTPTVSVLEVQVSMLTNKLAEAEAGMQKLQEENAMLRDQLSTMQFQSAMHDQESMEMEQEARAFLEQELALTKQRADSLQADLCALQANYKQRETETSAALADQRTKEGALKSRLDEMEAALEQARSELETGRRRVEVAETKAAEAVSQMTTLKAKYDAEASRANELQSTIGFQAHQMMQTQRTRDEFEAKFQKAMEQLIATQTTHQKQVKEFQDKIQQQNVTLSQLPEFRERYRQMKMTNQDLEQRARAAEAKSEEAVAAVAGAEIEKNELLRMCNELLLQLEAVKAK